MARPKELANCRYGRLLVVGERGRTSYGGREQTLWACRCDCGNELSLPTDKLPHSAGAIRAAERAGRLPYTCCEACRQKVCPLCGTLFRYSHTSYLCQAEKCQQEQRRRREEFWHARSVERYQIDPLYRQQMRDYYNRYYTEHAEHVKKMRRQKLADMTEVEQAERRAAIAQEHAEYYAAVKRDPERYAQRMAGIRQRRAIRELERFLVDAQTLVQKNEDTK